MATIPFKVVPLCCDTPSAPATFGTLRGSPGLWVHLAPSVVHAGFSPQCQNSDPLALASFLGKEGSRREPDLTTSVLLVELPNRCSFFCLGDCWHSTVKTASSLFSLSRSHTTLITGDDPQHDIWSISGLLKEILADVWPRAATATTRATGNHRSACTSGQCMLRCWWWSQDVTWNNSHESYWFSLLPAQCCVVPRLFFGNRNLLVALCQPELSWFLHKCLTLCDTNLRNGADRMN